MPPLCIGLLPTVVVPASAWAGCCHASQPQVRLYIPTRRSAMNNPNFMAKMAELR